MEITLRDVKHHMPTQPTEYFLEQAKILENAWIALQAEMDKVQCFDLDALAHSFMNISKRQ